MRYAAMTTEQLKMTEANVRDEIAKGGSVAVMKARYGVLGAVSAELANRK